MYQNIPALSMALDGKPYPLSRTQRKRIRSLIRVECCNYDSRYGECLGPDRNENGDCSQLGSSTLDCRWFNHAVLPLDQTLFSEIIRDPEGKKCAICGSLFVPGSGRALYCASCAAQIKKRNKRESARRRRHDQKAGKQGVGM